MGEQVDEAFAVQLVEGLYQFVVGGAGKPEQQIAADGRVEQTGFL